jgi:hypothetical protein
MRVSLPNKIRKAGRRIVLSAACLYAAAALTGCIFSGAGEGEKGVVRSEQADVYSSTALVALKVATVKRGDVVYIIKRESVAGPTYTEDWINVRVPGDEDISGWIEARHVVSDLVVQRSAEIAGKADEVPALARGRVKVNQRLRLGPGRDQDVAIMLQRGTTFDIIGKRLSTYTPEPKAKPKAAAEGGDTESAAPDTTPDEEEKTDVWYQVRLPEDSIVKGGWILAGSVSVEAPDEILHLEGDGRRFVAWQVVNSVQDPKQGEKKNYATFMRRGDTPDELDFERIYFLFWDPNTHNYYAPYVDSELRGAFPIRQRDEGGRKILEAQVLDEENNPQTVQFDISRDERGKWLVRRVTPPIRGEKIRRRR